MQDLNELQIFAIVAREKSFTRAAAVLHISKSAASRAVAALEARLGIRLFERSTRHLRLTEAGTTYCSFATRAMDEVAAGESAVSRLTREARGTLRVALPVTLARASAAPALAAFLRAHPDLRVEMVLRGGQIAPLSDGVDLALQTARPAKDSRLIRRRIAVVELGLFAAPPYLAAAPPIGVPRDLMQHSCLTMMSTEADASIWTLRRRREAERIPVRGRVAVGDPVVHHQLCLDAVGVAVLPTWLADDDLRRARLVRVLAEWTPEPIELYAIYATRRSVTPKVKAFLNFIESVVPGRPREGQRPHGGRQ